jgi:hypothetical protein
MSGIGFYLTKLLAIVTVALVYFIVLGVFSFVLSKMVPDDPSESLQVSVLIILGYVAAFTALFYIARTQLKRVPDIFDGIQGFNSQLLKERDGSAFSAMAMILLAKGLTDRATRVRDHIVATYY